MISVGGTLGLFLFALKIAQIFCVASSIPSALPAYVTLTLLVNRVNEEIPTSSQFLAP